MEKVWRNGITGRKGRSKGREVRQGVGRLAEGTDLPQSCGSCCPTSHLRDNSEYRETCNLQSWTWTWILVPFPTGCLCPARSSTSQSPAFLWHTLPSGTKGSTEAGEDQTCARCY